MLISLQPISPACCGNKYPVEIRWGDGWKVASEGVAVRVTDPCKPNELENKVKDLQSFYLFSRLLAYYSSY